MISAFDFTAFDRATEPVLRLLPMDLARNLADYRPEDALQARVEELASKNNEGELTKEERAEYSAYVQANKFIAILQAQARRRLSEGE